MGTSRPPSLAWSVSAADDPDAFDRYRADMAGYYEVSDVAPEDRRNFVNQSSVTFFQAGMIGRGLCVGQTLARTARNARSSGVDSISLIVNRARIVGDCDGVDINTGGGAVHFRDLARPAVSHLDTVDLVNLVIPRDQAPPWLLAADLHGRHLSGESPLGRLLGEHLTLLSAVAADMTEAEGEAAIAAALLMAERAFGGETPLEIDQKAAVYRTVRQRASRVIEARLLDPGLSVDDIAREAAVSRTSLYRAFDPVGGVRRHVTDRRLQRAHEALERQVVGAPLDIAAVAGAHGFAGVGQFVRLFRERFGYGPDEIEPLVMTTAAGRMLETRGAHNRVVDWLRRRA